MATETRKFELPEQDSLDFTSELMSKAVSDVDEVAGSLATTLDDDVDIPPLSEADVGRLMLFSREIRGDAELLLRDCRRIEEAIRDIYNRSHDMVEDYATYRRRVRGLYERYLAERFQDEPRANERGGDDA